ncbi:MAG: molybdopterin-dependent oxidoreductase [Deltaproteobacteria bacterium]|nr:molybdopterin-dependent oxidoreductase [Deltaproteobacteria bacterium]
MEGEWIKTHCSRFDHGGCGLKVLVEKGKALRVLPDKSNPRSRGYVCPKGMATLERIYHPERLLTPLKRRGERGRGEWENISWDHALDIVAEEFNRIKTGFGPQAVAFAQGAPKGIEYLMMMRLANVFGTPNVAGTQHVCHMPRELMGRVTCGFLPVPDYEMPTSCIMLWGSNPYNTNEEGILGIHLKRSLLKDRPELIVIDPHRTDIAQRAGLWLQIKPGSDDFLALGLLNVIINERLYDQQFIEKWTQGFDDLKKHVQAYTPAAVSKETWIPEDKILKAARIYAGSTPALIHWGNALDNNGVNTSQTCRALVILMAMTGNLDAPGGNIQAALPEVMSLRKFIAADHLPIDPDKSIKRYYGVSPGLPLVPSSLLIKTVLSERPYPIKSLFVQASNPLVSYADACTAYKALNKLDFLVVSDIFMTPTAALADLVLPAATNLEYNDIGHYGLPHGYILARPGVIEPRGECWSDMRIINELGKRLGFAEYFWNDSQDILEEIVAPSGLNYAQFVEKGIIKGDKRYYQYRNNGFKTPSGKVEIYSSILKNQGYQPLPAASVNPEAGNEFPLILINSKPKGFFHSAYRSLESLRKRYDKPRIRMHPLTASRYKISDGDSVAIISSQGRIVQNAVLTESLHPEVVMADYGWWFPERGQGDLFAWKESNLNVLTGADPPYDPVLGTTALRGIPCRIEKEVFKQI